MPVVACGVALAFICAMVPVEHCCSEVHLPISYEEAYEVQSLEASSSKLPEPAELLPSAGELEFDDGDEEEVDFASSLKAADEANTTWNLVSRLLRNVFCASCTVNSVKTAGPLEVAIGSGSLTRSCRIAFSGIHTLVPHPATWCPARTRADASPSEESINFRSVQALQSPSLSLSPTRSAGTVSRQANAAYSAAYEWDWRDGPTKPWAAVQ